MKYTIAQRQQVRELREDGLTLKQIAAQLGVSQSFASHWGSGDISPEDRRAIVELRGQMLGQDAIAAKLYVARSVVARVLLEEGDRFDARIFNRGGKKGA